MTEPAAVRQVWPQVLEAVARRSKVAWVILQSVHVVGAEGRLLQLGFNNPGLRDTFHGSNREETLREALREVTGVDWKIDAIVDPSAGTGPAPGQPGAMPRPAAPPPAMPAPAAASTGFGASGQGSDTSGGGASGASGGGSSASQGSAGASASGAQAPSEGSSAGMSAPSFAAPSGYGAPPPFAQPGTPPEEDQPQEDDEDVEDAGPTARDLLVRELGATVLDETSDAD